MELNDAVEKLSALAQSLRLQVFRLLVRCGDEGLCAGDIAKHLDISSNTLSFHLKELENSELIKSERHGRSIIYSLRVHGIRDLITFLSEDCCQGRPELCMINTLPEK